MVTKEQRSPARAAKPWGTAGGVGQGRSRVPLGQRHVVDHVVDTAGHVQGGDHSSAGVDLWIDD